MIKAAIIFLLCVGAVSQLLTTENSQSIEVAGETFSLPLSVEDREVHLILASVPKLPSFIFTEGTEVCTEAGKCSELLEDGLDWNEDIEDAGDTSEFRGFKITHTEPKGLVMKVGNVLEESNFTFVSKLTRTDSAEKESFREHDGVLNIEQLQDLALGFSESKGYLLSLAPLSPDTFINLELAEKTLETGAAVVGQPGDEDKLSYDLEGVRFEL